MIFNLKENIYKTGFDSKAEDSQAEKENNKPVKKEEVKPATEDAKKASRNLFALRLYILSKRFNNWFILFYK